MSAEATAPVASALTRLCEAVERRSAARRAGASARGRYRAGRRAWLHRTRRQRRALGAVLLLIVVAVHVAAVLADGDQTWGAGLIAGACLASFWVAREAPPARVQRWQAGAFGEQDTARELRRLPSTTWRVVHDLPRGRYNIDHVVVGPSGVFVLDSTWSACHLAVAGDGVLRLTDPDQDDLESHDRRTLPSMRAQAAWVKQRIEHVTGVAMPVRPVLVWWGTTEVPRREHRGVLIVQAEHLVDCLQLQPRRPVLDPDGVVAALRTCDEGLR